MARTVSFSEYCLIDSCALSKWLTIVMNKINTSLPSQDAFGILSEENRMMWQKMSD